MNGSVTIRFPLDLPDLEEILRRLIAAIPASCVASCGTLAEILGDSRAARWIGTWLGEHEHNDACACHRVVRAGGRWGESFLGLDVQQRLLREEGVAFTADGVDPRCIIDSLRLRDLCPEVAAKAPLAALRSIQERLYGEIRLCPLGRELASVGGIDVSYKGNRAVAVYCHIAWPSGNRLWDTHVVLPARFPYISGYLAFRELPGMLAAIEEAKKAGQLAEVILVDGSGVLHPRGMGIASHLGVLLGRPTIGVSKKLLCGDCDPEGLQPGESRPISYRGQLLGAVLRSQQGHSQPVFVCPGHQIDVYDAVKIVSPLFASHRLPEPIYWADRISRSLARRLA
ncbi:MAG: endonuclease V [Thermogutta sp.]